MGAITLIGDPQPTETKNTSSGPEPDLPYYRLYFLDVASRIREVIDMECVDDAAALAQVAPYIGKGRAMELWNQDRVVRKFDVSARAA